jgi:hypothetical protein
MLKIVCAKLEAARVTPESMRGYRNEGLEGFFQIWGPCAQELTIISSLGDDPICEGWEHVSVSTPRRCPNWVEMCFVKDLFWAENECVVQFHPKKAAYINNHPFVLHMWKNVNFEFPTPPGILVGLPELNL